MPEAEGVRPQRLPDGAIVVRGGLMLPADLAMGVQSQFDRAGVYALSVFSIPLRTADEIARSAELPHSTIRVTSVGRLRSAGYDVVDSPGPPGHADLVFPGPPTEGDWRILDEIFDPPRFNPATMRADDR